MKRRLLSVVLALTIVASLVLPTVNVFAVDDFAFGYTLSDVRGPGGQFELTIALEDVDFTGTFTAGSSLSFFVELDSTIFTIESFTLADGVVFTLEDEDITMNPAPFWFELIAATSAADVNGALMTLVISVDDDAVIGDEHTIEFTGIILTENMGGWRMLLGTANEITVEITTIPVDPSELEDLIVYAQNLHTNTPVGSDGLSVGASYVDQATADELAAAIVDAQNALADIIADPDATAADVAAAVAALQAAIDEFKDAMNTVQEPGTASIVIGARDTAGMVGQLGRRIIEVSVGDYDAADLYLLIQVRTGATTVWTVIDDFDGDFDYELFYGGDHVEVTLVGSKVGRILEGTMAPFIAIATTDN